MNSLQRWMYRTLLQEAFFCSTRPYLPDDDNELWVLAGCENKAQWVKNKVLVLGMFKKEEKGLIHDELKADYERWSQISEKKALAGSKGGQAKAAKKIADAKQELDICLAKSSNIIELEVNRSEGNEETGDDMSATSKIKKLAGTKLGWVGFIGQGETAILNQLALAYGGEQNLATEFELYAELYHEGTDPIRGFIKFAKDNATNYRQTMDLKDDRLKPLLVKVYTVSGQSPAGKSKLAAETLLKEYSPEEIITAFSEDYANRDEFRAKNAVREFFELGGGEAIILAIRERKSRESTETELLARERVILTENAAKELENLEKETQEADNELSFFENADKTQTVGVGISEETAISATQTDFDEEIRETMFWKSENGF